MAKSKDSQPVQEVLEISQPRAISPDSSIVRYKGSMQLELQKFGDITGARQMLMSEALGGELAQDEPIEVTGLDLSETEDRALSAIQILHARTGYQGNRPGELQASPEWGWPGTWHRMAITYSAYFEAYGLSQIDGRYQGVQRDQAIEALKSLSRTRRIIYKRQRWEGQGKKRKPVFDVIVATKPLINIVEGYKGLEQEEAAQVEAGQTLHHRNTTLVIDIGPLLVVGLDDYFLLKPTTLHQEIRALLGSRPVARAVSLFIEWLLTKNLPQTSISRDKLARKLRLDYLIQERKQSRIQERLLEAIQTAQELGYLLKWEEDAFGIYHFTLNPDRMGRPPKWQLRAGDEDEENSS